MILIEHNWIRDLTQFLLVEGFEHAHYVAIRYRYSYMRNASYTRSDGTQPDLGVCRFYLQYRY